MSFEIVYTHNFEREIKHLAKKHRSIKKDLSNLIIELENNPELGTPIGNNCFKVRMAISSKGKGKSGGARVITHLYIKGKIVYLLSAYDKSEHESVSETKIKELIKKLN